jgi:hypothetical protein
MFQWERRGLEEEEEEEEEEQQQQQQRRSTNIDILQRTIFTGNAELEHTLQTENV